MRHSLQKSHIEELSKENLLYDPLPPVSENQNKDDSFHETSTHMTDPLPKLFESTRPDKLFWAIYTHVYGPEEYYSIGHSYGNRALEEKNKIASHIKKNSSVFKTATNYKITNVMIQEIQSEFMTMHSKTSYIEVLAMAFFYGIEIVLCFDNNTYMTFVGKGNRIENVDPLCIIYVKGNSYKLELQPNPESIQHMFKYHHYLRPLNTISNYKTEELYAIWHKLGIPPFIGKPKKQDMYYGIVEHLSKVL